MCSNEVCRIFDLLQTLGLPVYDYHTQITDVSVAEYPDTRDMKVRSCDATIQVILDPNGIEPTYRYVYDAIDAKRKQDKEARMRAENPMLAELYKEYEATLALCGG